jgi:hypothetical protein
LFDGNDFFDGVIDLTISIEKQPIKIGEKSPPAVLDLLFTPHEKRKYFIHAKKYSKKEIEQKGSKVWLQEVFQEKEKLLNKMNEKGEFGKNRMANVSFMKTTISFVLFVLISLFFFYVLFLISPKLLFGFFIFKFIIILIAIIYEIKNY